MKVTKENITTIKNKILAFVQDGNIDYEWSLSNGHTESFKGTRGFRVSDYGDIKWRDYTWGATLGIGPHVIQLMVATPHTEYYFDELSNGFRVMTTVGIENSKVTETVTRNVKRVR